MAGQRQSVPAPLEFAPGLYTNETDRGAKQRWISGDNVRWLEGLAEKIGGYELSEMFSSTEIDEIVTYMGKVRSTWEWDSLDGETWIAFGTACKLYLLNRGVLYDITPMRLQHNVVDGFTTAIGTTTVTVVDPSHDAQDGDHFRILSDITVGGITIAAGEYDVLAVVDLNTFTFTIPDVAVSTATSSGTVTVQYDISCGLESDGPLFGYGVGPYGEGTYGTARTESTFIGKLRVWSLDNWGEDLLASPNGETLFEWRRVWGPDSRARAVVGAPANIERMIVGPDDRHVIAFGTNLASTGQHDKMFVRWCEGDDYTNWIAAATNDAGSKRLDSGSRLITAIKTRSGIVVFTDRSLYFVSLVGGTDVYSILPVAGVIEEIVSPEAAIEVDGVVYFMTQKNFYRFDGTLQIMPCDIRTLVFGVPGIPGFNKAHIGKVHVRVIKEFNEIWWSYPSRFATENDSTAIYNYRLDCWYFSSIPREAGRSASPSLDRQPYAFYNNRFWIHESGYNGDDGEGFLEPLHSFLHSYQRELLEGAIEVRLTKLIPDFDVLEGPIDVSVEGRERPQSPVKTRGPFIVFDDTERVCPDLRVRQVAIAIDSNELGVFWRMGTWSAYATPTTRRS